MNRRAPAIEDVARAEPARVAESGAGRRITTKPLKTMLATLRQRLRRRVKRSKMVWNARWMASQIVPMQSVNRTLFTYDVTFWGEPAVYAPKMRQFPDAPRLSLNLMPQAFSPTYHYRVPGAVISRTDVVDPNAEDRVLMELLTNPTPIEEGETWILDRAKRRRIAKAGRHPSRRVGDAYIFSNPNWDTYYHFVIDAAMRYSELDFAGAFRPDTEILTDVPPSRWQAQYMSLMGMNQERIGALPAFGEAPIVAESLLVGSPPRSRFVVHPGAVRRFRDRMQDACGIEPGQRDKRIYVSRRGVGRRSISNEAEVIACLETAGFEVAELETMSVREQIALFARAEVIAGPHGAGLTNMIYGRKPTIIEFLPADRWNLGWFMILANTIESAYHPLVTQRGGAEYLRTEVDDAPFEVDVKALRKTLETVGA